MMYFVHISIFCWFLPFPGVSQTRFKLKQDHLRPKLFFNKAIKYETNKTWRYIEIKRYKKKLKAGYEGISGYNDAVIVPRGLHFSMPNWLCTLKRAEGIVIQGQIQECLKVGGGGCTIKRTRYCTCHVYHVSNSSIYHLSSSDHEVYQRLLKWLWIYQILFKWPRIYQISLKWPWIYLSIKCPFFFCSDVHLFALGGGGHWSAQMSSTELYTHSHNQRHILWSIQISTHQKQNLMKTDWQCWKVKLLAVFDKISHYNSV